MRNFAIGAAIALLCSPAFADPLSYTDYVSGVRVTRIVTPTLAAPVAPVSAAAGMMTITDVTVPATTSTTIAAANPARLMIEIQCSAGPTKINLNGQTLTSASQGSGNAGIILPTAASYYQPPIVTLSAITAYGPSGTCTVQETTRQ